MTKTLTLDEALSELYAFAYQDGLEKIRQDHPYHRTEAKQAIFQWVADEVVGGLQYCPYLYCESHTCRHWEELRDKQRQILKDHGWKPKEE